MQAPAPQPSFYSVSIFLPFYCLACGGCQLSCRLDFFASRHPLGCFKEGMKLTSALFCFLLLVTLLSGHLLTDDRTTRRPRKGDLKESRKSQTRSRQQRSVSFQDDDHECQEGNPLGASYSGRMNVTASGRTCQVWAVSQPHEHKYADVGEHNFCRNPGPSSRGVWCYTTAL